MKAPKITEEQMTKYLDGLYGLCINGIPKTKSCRQLAQEYLAKYDDPAIAAKKLFKQQTIQCTAVGFATGLGGLITLPVDITSVFYMQLRLIATTAVIAGYNLEDDYIKTLCLVCFIGSSLTKTCQDAGIKIVDKVTLNVIKKIPGKVLTKINQRVGFRLVTKSGTKGVINLTKMFPIAGGFVGGGLDYVTTKIIAKKAYNTFILEKFD